ncbi:preprotein translocase subunit SecG [Thalassotalea sp. LPB0316]|uniref:preprotein translocase subunit SecG n=1 Tax=Thalassotalea sp. LPB0316 TaxID=2769490 RepID=UPI001865E374|nr:preprotein translocase subunit SecG [Thalassotalea sp. LPB0316]QOL25236.1 preprotein translocase subunit SecG [Thalassotalea sp. LPB0316]
MLYEILIIVYLIVALCLIGFILIQQGKGADMGASFGAGSSATIFGSSGSGNFMTRATTYLAIAFFAISLVLGKLTVERVNATDEWNNLEAPVESSIPADTSAEPVPNKDVPAASDKSESDIPD